MTTAGAVVADLPEEAGTVPLTFIGGAGAERAAVGTLGFLARAVGVTERAAPILERAAQVTSALQRSRAGQWLLRGLEVVRPRGVGVSAVAAKQTERYTPLVMENLEPWRRAVDGWLDPQKYPVANKFLRDLPQELALAPGGVFGFKAAVLEAAAHRDTKAMGQLAETMARPFYSPVESFKENPAGTVLMWAMVGGTYAERLRAQVKASNEVERRALEAFADMMAEQRAGVRQGVGLEELAKGSRVYAGWLEDYPELAKEFPAEAELYREAIAAGEKAQGKRPELDAIGRSLASRHDAQWVGDTKSVESTVEKVARERRRNPRYGVADVNDHVRGSIIVPDWETYAAVVEDLYARGYRIRQWLDRPMRSGYRGTHATFSMGDGISAEIQVHVEASWEISRAEHGSYETDRRWRYVPVEKVPPEVRERMKGTRARTRAKYGRVYAPMPEPIRRRIAALAKASAQRERGQNSSP